jgi:hypothetical protein
MTPATRLSTALDERLDGLPSTPPEHYLAAGLAAAHSRRRRAGFAAGVAGVVAAAVLAAGWALPLGDGPQRAREHQASVAAPPLQAAASLSSLRIEPGVGTIDSYTTDDIPEWATEYGNHGPVAIAPDGRLWVAPEATMVRSIDDPVGQTGQAADVSHSYAVEVRWDAADDKLATHGVVWSFVYQQAGEPATYGELDSPERWTADFGVWVDDKTADLLGRAGFAERLAQFASDRSDELVPGADVEIVQQRNDVATGDRPRYARQTAAEVRIDAQTWFVLASGRKVGQSFYEAYDETSAAASDLEGFLRFVEAGFVRPGGAS